MKNQLISINKFSRMVNRTPQTLRNWDAAGKLKPHTKGLNGYRFYLPEQVNEVFGLPQEAPDRIIVGYCRVSSLKQKDDLVRQEENLRSYLTAKGEPFEIISDIGSGINYNKKGLKEIIRRITAKEISKVVVLYKDRLLRFGFELVDFFASLYDCKIEIVDNTQKTAQAEMVEDLVQIITVFSCKLQGNRANRAKKIIQELRDEAKNLQN